MSNKPEPNLEDLPSFAFVGLASFLQGEDVLQLRCTSMRVKGLIDDEADVVWTRFLCNDFGYHQAKEGGRQALIVAPAHFGPSVFGTAGSQAVMEMPSAFETWKQWKLASWRYSGGGTQFLLNAPYFLRAAGIWARLEQWLLLQGAIGSSIRSSLNRGLTLLDLPWPDDVATLSTVRATQALLSFYGGQTTTRRDPWNGLFGGFSAYHYLRCTFFRGGEWDHDDGVIEIGSCPVSHYPTAIVVNPSNGFVEYATEPRVKICPSDQEDAVLDWFNEYVTRLETGYYQPGCIYRRICRQTMGPMDPVDAILQFPRLVGRGATRAITNGVEVITSHVYSPFTETLGFSFIYSIWLRLLEPNDEGYDENRGFDSCQLKSRHWRLANLDGGTDSVDGDGVIGLYPLLREGSHRVDSGHSATSVMVGAEVKSGSFQYESCTDDSAASFAGYMLFVPGSLRNPTGPPFKVHLAPFLLDPNPEYQY